MSSSISSRLRITLKSFDNDLIDRSFKEIINVAVKSGANVVGPISMPARVKKFDLLRSPHIYKEAMDQIEISFYKKILDIRNCTVDTISSLSNLELISAVEVNIKELSDDKSI